MLISPGLIRAQNCSEVLIIFARGSGQGQNKPEEQKEAYKFFNEIKDRAPSGITVENKELVYPATGGPMPESYPVWLNAEFPWNAAGTYHLSVSDEISSLTTLLNEQIRDCPNQRFVLGGYSQGANVVGDTLFQLSDEIEQKIAYVALFGDPKFKPDSYAARGDYFAGGHGDGGILEKRKAEFPLQYMGRLTSWCKTSDGICENFIPTAFGPLSKHPTYSDFEIPIAANYAAQELKRHFSGFQTKHIQPGSLGNEVDIVYAVDTTATMQGVLNNLKANLQSLTQQTMALGTDTRVGLTIYNDKANGCSVKEPRTELLLTNDGEQFKNRFSTLSGMCGGSAGDDTYAGLMTAINAQPWRPNARKVVVLLAGNSPNNPDKSMPGTTQATAVNAALAKGIAIHGVVRGDLPSQVSTHKTMIETTGGIPIFMKAGSTSEYMRMYDHIVQLWSQVTNMPSVSINQTRPTQLGQQIQFNAGGTFDPDSSIANYEWDFNNDGIIEMTSDQPVVSYTYSLAYNGVAVVKSELNRRQ